MTVLVLAAALIPVAVVAAIILEPHLESWATRKQLSQAHSASGRTSHTDNPSSEPHTTSSTAFQGWEKSRG